MRSIWNWFVTTARTNWTSVGVGKLITFAIGVAILFLILIRNKQGWVHVLDDANLAFHEAGHIFYGLLGETMGLYGGTLGQLTFPLICFAIFWAARKTMSFAVCGIWFFENFLNIARYMADARARALPLVGGGDHDWTTIFSRWQALNSDTKIAAVVKVIGWIGMIALVVWVSWRWYKDKKEEEQREQLEQ